MSIVDYTPQEVVEVVFCTAFADPENPTVAEANAGTRITHFLTDGPPAPAGSSFVDSGDLSSGFQSQVASTYGGGSGTMTVKVKRDTTTTDASADTAVALFPRKTVGFLVEAPFGVSGVAPDLFAAGDVVTIKAIEVGNDVAAARTNTRGALQVAPVELAFTALPITDVALV